MSAEVLLGCGDERVPFPLVSTVEWEVLEPASPDEEAGSSSLGPLLDGLLPVVFGTRTRAALVMPDLTRPAPVKKALPVVVEALERRGLARSRQTLLVAAGTHVAPPVSELQSLWDVPAGLALRVHDARAAGVARGATPAGTPVELNVVYAGSEWRLTLGGVSLHYLAGFGGGPKMVFPGVASRDGAAVNHKRALGPWPPGGLAPGCAPGVVEGNPVAEDIARAAELDPPDVALHVTRANGSWRYHAGAAGLASARESVLVRGRRGEAAAYDVVAASLGGAPRDVDVVQSHKALAHAARFARPGATVFLFARTPQGAGSESFARWLTVSDAEELERRARAEYDLNAQTAISLRGICARHRVYWVGSEAPELVERAGAIPIAPGVQIEEAVLGLRGRGAVLPVATEMVPRTVTAAGASR